jgi:hypothetical protein
MVTYLGLGGSYTLYLLYHGTGSACVLMVRIAGRDEGVAEPSAPQYPRIKAS